MQTPAAFLLWIQRMLAIQSKGRISAPVISSTLRETEDGVFQAQMSLLSAVSARQHPSDDFVIQIDEAGYMVHFTVHIETLISLSQICDECFWWSASGETTRCLLLEARWCSPSKWFTCIAMTSLFLLASGDLLCSSPWSSCKSMSPLLYFSPIFRVFMCACRLASTSKNPGVIWLQKLLLCCCLSTRTSGETSGTYMLYMLWFCMA